MSYDGVVETLGKLRRDAPAGYAIAIMVELTAPRYLFQTYSSEWMAEYSRRGFVRQDPTVAWGFGNTGRIDWNDLEPQDEAGVFAAARKFGCKFGFTLSIDQNGRRSIASFSRQDRPYFDSEMDRIEDCMKSLVATIEDFEKNDPDIAEKLQAISVSLTRPA